MFGVGWEKTGSWKKLGRDSDSCCFGEKSTFICEATWSCLVAQMVESICSAGDPGSTPGLGRTPGEGNGNPLWYSCLENPIDRGAWQAIVRRVTKSQTQLSGLTHLC